METDLPIRVLTNFTIYDPKNGNELVLLDVLHTPEGHNRELVVVGYAKAHFDEQDSEDEGQEEDLDEGNEEEGYVFLELSAVFKQVLDCEKYNECVLSPACLL